MKKENNTKEAKVIEQSDNEKENPALKVKLPRYDIPDSDPAHIFSKEEIKIY